MPKQIDEAFYERADAHLRLAAEQLRDVPGGRISASMMYACARFNVWLSASGKDSAGDLRKAYGETIEYFVAEYRKMLVKNLDDHVENFNQYVPKVPEHN